MLLAASLHVTVMTHAGKHKKQQHGKRAFRQASMLQGVTSAGGTCETHDILDLLCVELTRTADEGFLV